MSVRARSAAAAWALAAAHVALWVASFPPHGLWALSLVAWTPLCVLAARGGGRMPLLAVAVTSFIGWMWMQRFLVDVTVAGYPALGAYMALWGVAGFAALRRCATSGPGASLPMAVVAPCVVTCIEWLRGAVVLDGYPWYHAGHPLIDASLIAQVADISGASLATVIASCAAGAAADVILAGDRGRRVAVAGVGCAAALLASATGYGLWRSSEASGSMRPGPWVLAVQTNLPIDNKIGWTRERQERDIVQFAGLTVGLADAARARGEQVDLAVWPETMLPGLGMEPDAVRLLVEGNWWPGDRFARVPQLLAERIGAPMLVGSPAYVGLRAGRESWEWDRHHNSAYLVTAAGAPYVRVDKLFLTPFGETMPYISRWDWLERQLLEIGARGMTFDLEPGSAPVRIDVPVRSGTPVRAAVPICFEITVPHVVRRMCWEGSVRQADVLVNITNDGWFGSHDAGRAQHGLIGRWRAIENRAPLVRVANTGISAAFDSLGRPIPDAQCAPRTEGGFAVRLDPDCRVPPFAHVGDIASLAMSAATAILLLWRRRTAAGTRVPAGATAACAAMCAILCAGSIGCERPVRSDNAVQTQMWGTRQLSTTDRGSAGMPAPMGQRIPLPPEADGREAALSVLMQASRSADASQRANALEALSSERALLADVARPALGDPNRGVRFAACMCVGRSGIQELGNLVEPLALDESGSVRAAALFALSRLGRQVDLTPLAALAMSEDPEVRGNAVMVLGELREPSAVPLIEAAARRPLSTGHETRARIVDLQCAESLVKLGQQQYLDPIRAALFAPSEQAELIALACQIVGEVKDEGSRGSLMRLWNAEGGSTRPPEIRLAAATALARLGEPDMRPVLTMTRLVAKTQDPFIRAQAATALGWIPTVEAQVQLDPMLRDRNPYVQIAAASAWLRGDRLMGRVPSDPAPVPGFAEPAASASGPIGPGQPAAPGS